jgi:NADPH:quinone reductase-like Zn-dependent oxidoreductase
VNFIDVYHRTGANKIDPPITLGSEGAGTVRSPSSACRADTCHRSTSVGSRRKGSLSLSRPTLAHYVLTREELLWRAGDVLNGVASGALKLRIDSTFPLAAAAEAHRALESRKTAGKILLEIGTA